jgi:hypothetical protein
MRRIGPLIAEARATIEAQAAHIQKQSLEYISLFDQCSEAQDRVKALEVKCALLAASLDQEEKRSEALEAGLTDGVTDDMAVLQSRVEELEAQLRERGEPVAWRFKTRSSNERWRYEEFEPTHISDYVFEKYPLYYHPPAAAATFTCAARRQGSAGGNDPADCDWPTCGCDEHASKVIATLQESGHLKEPAAAASEWRPIESAPKDGVIQLWVPPFGIWVDGPWRGAWSYAAQQWVLHSPFTAADGRSICVTDIPHPTHWMPLPTAPSIAAQKEREE